MTIKHPLASPVWIPLRLSYPVLGRLTTTLAFFLMEYTRVIAEGSRIRLSLSAFSITSGFIAGTNTLDFRVANGTPSPLGVLQRVPGRFWRT